MTPKVLWHKLHRNGNFRHLDRRVANHQLTCVITAFSRLPQLTERCLRSRAGSFRSGRVGVGFRGRPPEGGKLPSVEQCRAYAANYKILGADPTNSSRRTTVLTSISHSGLRWRTNSRTWRSSSNRKASKADRLRMDRPPSRRPSASLSRRGGAWWRWPRP